MGVFLTRATDGVPKSMSQYLECTKTLPESCILMSICPTTVPFVHEVCVCVCTKQNALLHGCLLHHLVMQRQG